MPSATKGYEDRIVVDRRIMAGKPIVRGTRIPVEIVLGHLAETPDLDDLLAAYPRLTLEDVQACFAFAEEALRAGSKRRGTNEG